MEENFPSLLRRFVCLDREKALIEERIFILTQLLAAHHCLLHQLNDTHATTEAQLLRLSQATLLYANSEQGDA